MPARAAVGFRGANFYREGRGERRNPLTHVSHRNPGFHGILPEHGTFHYVSGTVVYASFPTRNIRGKSWALSQGKSRRRVRHEGKGRASRRPR